MVIDHWSIRQHDVHHPQQRWGRLCSWSPANEHWWGRSQSAETAIISVITPIHNYHMNALKTDLLWLTLQGGWETLGLGRRKIIFTIFVFKTEKRKVCQATVKWRFRSKAKCQGGGARYQGGGRGGVLQVYCQEYLPRQKNPTKCCSYGGVFFVHQVKLGRPGNYVDLLVMAERFILGRKVFILMLFVEAPTL